MGAGGSGAIGDGAVDGEGTRLEIRLLGGFAVARGGASVNIGSRAAQALLAYLALTAGARHRRERLAALLWPDASDESARQNLRNALWALRKALGEEHFLADKISVGLDPGSGYLLDAAELARGGGVAELEAAVAAYGGELLPGFYEEWVLLERERLRAEFDARMERLVELLLAEGRAHDALRWAERWVAQGQAPEPAYRSLMLARHALGDQAGVANAYRRCVKALEEELGVEPSPETRSLYERLLREPPEPRAEGPPAARPAAPAEPEQEPVTVPEATPDALPAFLAAAAERVQPLPRVVGREPELGRLAAALDDAVAGRGRAVFVTGEAGRGKSSLLTEFARRAPEEHPTLVVLTGNCDAFTGAGDPLLPFRDALETLTGDLEPRLLAGTLDRALAERLWRLMPRAVEAVALHGPELLGGFLRWGPLLSRAAQRDPSGRLRAALAEAAPTPSLADQGALFEAYTRVLRAVAAESPVVLLLEDLHWADASSVALLFHLARRLAGARVLVVGSLRAEELSLEDGGEARSLPRLVAELERAQGAVRVDLDAGAAGRAFVDELLDSEPNRLGEEFRERLARLTEGLPLFAVELLAEMRAAGGLVRDGTGAWTAAPDITWHALPARVEGVIRTRLERLDPDLVEALQVGSVEGATFTAEVVARVLGVDARQLTRRLSGEAERAHQLLEGVELARVGGRRLARFRFRHDLFQRYLYGGLTGLDRAVLHEEVGTALEELHAEETGAVAVELARHFEEGGLGERAARYLLAAGRQAAALYAHAEAAAHLRRALDLLAGAPASPENERVRLDALLLLGSSLQAMHGYSVPEVAAAFERARSVAAGLGAAREEFAAAWSLSLYHSQRAEYGRAVELGEELLAIGRREGDERLLLQAHHAVWFAVFCLGDFAAVLEHAAAGAALYPLGAGEEESLRTGNHDAGACAHLFAARSLWYLGRPDEALAEGERALELAAGFSRPDSLAHAYAHAAELFVLRGDGERAGALAARCREVAAANGLGFWAAWAAIMRGSALVLLGSVEEGIAAMRQGRAEYPGIGVAEELTLWARLAEAHADLGQAGEAEECLAAAFAAADRMAAEVWRAELHRLRGKLAALRGEAAAEWAPAFDLAADVASRHGARSLELRAATSRQEAALAAGDGELRREARAKLAAVLGTFTEGHDTADLRRARELLEGD
ncbi:MAG TPA: AAA family ATPase [Trueperaceae bacterium]